MVRASQAQKAQLPCIPAVSTVQRGQHLGTAAPGDKANSTWGLLLLGTELVLLAESSREGTQNSSDFSEV